MAVKIDSTATKGDRETHVFLQIFNSASSYKLIMKFCFQSGISTFLNGKS